MPKRLKAKPAHRYTPVADDLGFPTHFRRTLERGRRLSSRGRVATTSEVVVFWGCVALFVGLSWCLLW